MDKYGNLGFEFLHFAHVQYNERQWKDAVALTPDFENGCCFCLVFGIKGDDFEYKKHFQVFTFLKQQASGFPQMCLIKLN